MTMEELRSAWAEYVERLNGHPITPYFVNDFCNLYAKSYEEYMTIYELLADEIEAEDEFPNYTY